MSNDSLEVIISMNNRTGICEKCGGFFEEVDLDELHCDTCGRKVINGIVDDSDCDDDDVEINMGKIKECPFCGTEPSKHYNNFVEGVFILCCESEECAAHPRVIGVSECEVIKKWNKRVII